MPDFQYTAREATGSQVTGVLTAASERDALTALAGMRLFPMRIGLAETEKAQQKHVGRRVAPKYLSVFYTQLADLLKSGVPLMRSLELLERKSPNATLRMVIGEVRGEVSNGKLLADAMSQHPKVFGELAISMVRAGEEGSFLEDVLKRIADFTEHQENLKSRVVGAMVYPFFLMGMGGIVVTGMLVFFVPKFKDMFDSMSARGSLPWATKTLMSLSESLKEYGLAGLLILGGAGFFLYRALQTDEGKMRFDLFRLRAPALGPIVRSLAIARFCRILGTLLKNGVPILQSLRIAKDASGNRVLSEAIGKAAESVQSGKALAKPLSASGEFPEEVVEMISVGEEANNLEQVLVDIADNMERSTWRQLEMLVRLLEPVLLTIMAAIILFVVVALLTPILQSSGMV